MHKLGKICYRKPILKLIIGVRILVKMLLFVVIWREDKIFLETQCNSAFSLGMCVYIVKLWFQRRNNFGIIVQKRFLMIKIENYWNMYYTKMV